MPPPSHQHDGGSVAILLRAILDADLTLHPGKIALPGFFAEKLLIVMDQFCHDAATGNVIFIHENEPARRFKRSREVERHRRFGSNGQFSDLILIHHVAALLLSQIHRVDDPVNGRDFTIHFLRRHSELIAPPSLQRPPAQPEHIRAQGRRHQRKFILMRGDLSPLHKDLFIERHTD